jgi:hypothetical protein
MDNYNPKLERAVDYLDDLLEPPDDLVPDDEWPDDLDC